MEYNKLEKLLEKYKNIINSSYLKYNFMIDFHNIFDGNFKLDFTLKEKKIKNQKYILKDYIPINSNSKKPYFLTSNILYFLISEEFTSDIELLLIKKIDNQSSVFNGLIINLDRYEIICNPIKSKLISKNCNIRKFNDDEIMYEYDIYKYYDGINISLYYYNKSWNITGFNKININNISYDKTNSRLVDKFNDIILKYIIMNKIEMDIVSNIKNKDNYNNIMKKYDRVIDDIDNNELTEIKNELMVENILNKFYNNLDKRYTYNFVLINKNYNLCSKKDKIKYINKSNGKEMFYKDNMLNKIMAKRLDNLKTTQKYGIVLISRNNNEDRIVYYNNYYTINKLLYVHIKKNIFDINMIILKNIIIYKISKNILSEVFNKYIYLYNQIMRKVDILVDYLYDYISRLNFPNIDLFVDDDDNDENTVYKLKPNLIENIIKFIKKNKYLNDILFIDTTNEIDINNFKNIYFNSKELYKSMIKDYILHKDLINELYLYIF
jgi:hypothetical protein